MNERTTLAFNFRKGFISVPQMEIQYDMLKRAKIQRDFEEFANTYDESYKLNQDFSDRSKYTI